MRFGVAGYPVAHSRSPQMHDGRVRRAAGSTPTISGCRSRRSCSKRLCGRCPESGFHGINVTIPHKEAAAELADEVSPTVEAVGAANTLTFEDGRILAENTDAPGLMGAIARPVQGLRALVLGAGGTARAAAWALQDAGAEVSVWNRTTERAAKLADDLGVALLLDPEGGADSRSS